MDHQRSESVYEESCFNHYENNRMTPTDTAASHTKPLPPVPERETRKYCKKTFIGLACAIGIAIIALLSVLLVNQMSSYDAASQKMILPDSCLVLRQRKVQDSGIHKIQLPEANVPTEIFCDMETDGGGWSLVASIHEDNINAKCSRHDLWSDYVRLEDTSIKESSNWENKMVFGDPRRALFADFKSAAYYKMHASNVMIWHVPSGTAITSAKNNSMLRYRTSNNFLREYGGNLQALYNEFFPLSPKQDHDVIDEFLKPIMQSVSSIKYSIPGWYEYRIPSSGSYNIYDSKLFNSSGNRVYFASSDSPTIYVDVRYGREYRFTNIISNSFATSSLTTPFTFLAVIRNDFRRTSDYRIWVESYKRLTSSVDTAFEGNVTNGNFRLHYHAIQFYHSNRRRHTQCRFHFYVSNFQDWQSVQPIKFSQSYQSSSEYYPEYQTRIYGRPARILYGYMLLSRIAGQNYTEDDLDGIASSILQSVAIYPDLMDAWKDRSTLVVPVTFDVGSEQTVTKSIPETMRKHVTAGNLQFRAYNITGYPNALCPGVSVNTTSPEYVCVGGISNDITTKGTCGDFAGWGGGASDIISSKGASGFAHSSADISSTLLIFYR